MHSASSIGGTTRCPRCDDVVRIGNRKLTIATIAWARSDAEAKALVRSVARLAEAGIPIAIAVRGGNPRFAAALRRFAGVTVTVVAKQALVPQVQASLALAATFNTPFILYAEPDKEELFANRLRSFVERAPMDDAVGVVLASRSPAAFDSFPPMQRYTEGVFNHLCGEVIGIPGDYSYGPFVMNRSLLAHVARLDPRLGWGWRPATFAAAHRQALKVVHLVDQHACPRDQRSEDAAARAHRVRQLRENIMGLVP